MALITHTQVIDGRIDEVFMVVIDAGEYASWNPTIKESRRIDGSEIGNGSRFEWKLRGFGKVTQVLEEFERDRGVRIVPQIRSLSGGHRFFFAAEGERTRVDHELEMVPRGIFRLFTPMITRLGRKNLRDTAQALQTRVEGPATRPGTR